MRWIHTPATLDTPARICRLDLETSEVDTYILDTLDLETSELRNLPIGEGEGLGEG